VHAAGVFLLRTCTLRGCIAMRLWTLHPKYLDPQGLVALWREALLAQAVLHGATKGYRRHPQLERFRQQPDPLHAIAAYLCSVADEARQRGYSFDESKISAAPAAGSIMTATRGQLMHEWHHLLGKLRGRSPQWHAWAASVAVPEPHPMFRIVAGVVEPWERGSATHLSRTP